VTLNSLLDTFAITSTLSNRLGSVVYASESSRSIL